MLVCLDLQRGSIPDGESPDGCVVNCRRMLAHGREEGWRVVHVHSRMTDADEARPITGLEPLPSEPVLYRAGLSPFSNRTFRDMIASIGRLELVVIGYSVSQSFLATALIAFDQELSLVLVEDAVCSAVLDQKARDALRALGGRLSSPFAVLARTDDLIGGPRLRRVV